MPIDHFPRRIQPAAYRLRKWAMTDGPALLFISVLSLILGASYGGLFGGYQAMIHPIEEATTQEFWATVWALIGVGGLFGAIVSCERTRNVVFTLWSAMMLLWGSSYLIAWWAEDIDRGVGWATLYLLTPSLVSWTVWRGSRSELVVKEHR